MSDPEIKMPSEQISTSPVAGDTEEAPGRGGARNILLAYRHIRIAARMESIRQRLLDHVTVALVALCILLLGASVVFDFGTALRIVPLVITNLVLIFFVTRRVGIFLSVSPRQALIFWQVVLGAFWFGITSSLLVIVIGLIWSS